MCYFALIGAQAEVFQLRAAIQSVNDVFDTDAAPEVERLAPFPSSDTVVCVTLGGCSCALVAALEDGPRRSDHATTPSTSFRAVITNVTRRFGSSRLFIYEKVCDAVGLRAALNQPGSVSWFATPSPRRTAQRHSLNGRQ